MATKVRGFVAFDETLCKGCGLCATACPKQIISMSSRINEKGYSPAEVVDMDQCIGCGMCAMMCPDCVITVKRDKGVA